MDAMTAALIQSAREVLKSAGYCVENLWHVDDIHFLCEQRNWPSLTHEEAVEVFAIFSDSFDGAQGLTWGKLESATQSYLNQQGRIRDMVEQEQHIEYESESSLV